MSYNPTHRSYTASDNNNAEWYFKIISLREEMANIEDEKLEIKKKKKRH
jgi:hypothetical protein